MPVIKKLGTNGQKKSQNISEEEEVLGLIQPIGFEDDEGINMLLYGASGTGKTTLWATFPKPILAVICSGGRRRKGELRSIDTPEYRDSIRAMPLRKLSHLEVLFKLAESEGYKTVVIDHVTGLQDLILADICGMDSIPVQKEWGMASQDQYRESANKTKTYLRAFMDLSMNKVIIAHEREFSTEGLQDIVKPVIGANVQPAIWTWLNGAVDYVAQTYKRQKHSVKTITKNGKGGKPVKKVVRTPLDEEEYCLRIKDTNLVFFTKFRVPMEKGKKLPKVIVDPTYDKIYNMIRGETTSPAE